MFYARRIHLFRRYSVYQQMIRNNELEEIRKETAVAQFNAISRNMPVRKTSQDGRSPVLGWNMNRDGSTVAFGRIWDRPTLYPWRSEALRQRQFNERKVKGTSRHRFTTGSSPDVSGVSKVLKRRINTT